MPILLCIRITQPTSSVHAPCPRYILYETASEVWVDGPDGWRDHQRGPVKFEDFMKHENVAAAELTRPHVAALRLYTTLAFKYTCR